MPKRASSLLLALAMVLGVIGLTSPANADEADSVFKPSQLISVDISSSLGSPKLTRHYLNFEGYRRANLKISMPGTRHYVTLMNVGVHQKGSYTRRYEKVSLKIKLDAFVPGQSFLGLTRLTLNAMMQDPSMVHEVTAYQLYRAVGVPAPRTGYAKVRLDGRYMGLYLNLETVDSQMLSRWFNSTKHLYSGPQFCDLVPGNSCEVASVGDTDRADLITASQLSQLNGKAWWNKFSKLANVTEVLRLMATDVFLSNWDGYTDYSQNNHFMHFDKKGRFSILPWGTDQTFPSRSNYQLSWDGSTSPGKTKGYKQSTLFTHCLAYTPCQDRLLQEGYRVSKIAQNMDLAGFSKSVGENLISKKWFKNDISEPTASTLQFNQSWIGNFLKIRKQNLENFLALRSAIPLKLKVSKSVLAGQKFKPTLETSWEPGVSIHYQWFVGKTPIPGATQLAHRFQVNEIGHKVRLQVTLHKNGVAATSYFSHWVKVVS